MEAYISYQLYIELALPTTLTIGKLGTFDFPAGRYVYTGSAKRNIEARIKRHLSKHKKLKWHIDYLLDSANAIVINVIKYTLSECELNQQVLGTVIFPKFGATDCHAGCGSHLKLITD
jgi:Uri superfamily endonuclease